MVMRPNLVLLLLLLSASSLSSQEVPMPQLSPGSARKPPSQSEPALPRSVELTVPKGTPLQIALDQEIQVKKVGQTVHGRIVQPVYAFDRVVIPIGTVASGRITRIENVSGRKRTLAALDADFTPSRKVELIFDQLKLADGRNLLIATTVTPGSGQ